MTVSTIPGQRPEQAPGQSLFLATGADRSPVTLPVRKVSIVGCGAVGMACALSILHRGCMEELVLVDIAAERLEGEAMDLCHGLPFLPRTDLRAGTIEEAGRGSDVVVISAGIPQKPGESRLDLIGKNADLFRRLIPPIAEHCPDAVLLVVSNPVDVLTHIAGALSGFPPHRVIGSGTVLDSARFRMAISRRLGLDPHNVQALVLGEHGDSEVPIWSQLTVAGLPLHDAAWGDLAGPGGLTLEAVFDQEVRQAAQEIIRRKGSTSWAIGLATAEIVEAVLRSKERLLSVSTRSLGLYGLADVCLSLPTLVNDRGATSLVRLPLSELELERLHGSARLLEESLRAVGF
ncbi:L-lactate dehydrogenase [Synechococcus sp. RSCCF101]|uniref:L-lactate dehydrogenase n=1 Tax=Synechococcus sp. RSCCF101 TaxID=2511069 RepID=UPI0012471380|nr:L-lactate dehydrogenase [Synechococcus sp. RSCCF101]QEY32455.1 L-lactate dehydrogenase [Synechococcus sp. RSCCF101]